MQVGDKIISINNQSISSIDEMIKVMNDDRETLSLKVGYIRGTEQKETTLYLAKDENGVFKTGLYVKDSITGVGTLTFIDPKTNQYGALGHSITDSKTNVKFEVKNGKIFKADVASIDRSIDGKTGEKNAKFYFETDYGTITKNLDTGIYGIYKNNYNKDNLLEIANIKDIELGDALIRTTLDNNKIESFKIKILDIDESSNTKNLLFQITDYNLLNRTGGIVKGMSGSPIIQNNKIIGAVTHTVISDNTKGYGISIIKMLESME